MTPERRTVLGPLGRKLLVAFVLVALSSIVVLTATALVATTRGISASEDEQRQRTTDRTAQAVAAAYASNLSWAGFDPAAAVAVAASAEATLTIFDADGSVVHSSGGMGRNGSGRAMGMGSAPGRALTAAVVVAGESVGTVRLTFPTATTTARTIAWTWILLAAIVALAVATFMAWRISGRITAPLTRLAASTLAFAGGDRSARAHVDDAAADWEVGDLARAFDASADSIVRAEQERIRMSADIAHEIRTPLATLQAGLEELRDGFLEPSPERLESLHAQTVRLGRIVGDLAALSSAEAAGLALERHHVVLGDLLGAAIDAARPELAAAGIDIDSDLATAAVVNADPVRLHQLFGNLLGNVARYCREGDSVRISLATDAVSAAVTVSDTGPGIPPAEVPHVFDRLWRGSRASDVAGSGIGLAVARELVRAHGGTIDAESDGVHGTTFTVRLPLVA